MEKFSAIKEAFIQSGVDYNTIQYSITPYSLNTSLSFKFDNSTEFVAFLGIDIRNKAEVEQISQMITEAGLDPENYFFVNFYKPKVAEL